MTTTTATDLLGTPLTPDELALLDVYEQLKNLSTRELPPCADANVKEALANIAVAVTNLGLVYEHLLDFGC